jgi:hypothetical protein
LTMSPQARYKAALAAGFLALPGVARAERVAGATLPDEVQQLEPYRYRVEKKTYEETLKFYRTVYPAAKYPRRPIANQPGLRGVHIENPEPRPGGWDGLNVYELQGETRVFVLLMPGRKEAPRKK